MVPDTGVVSHFRGTNMVDFDRDRDANLSAFERTGGPASSALTVQDYFAAKIAVAMYKELVESGNVDWDFNSVASSAYAFSDSMMKMRDRKPKKQCTVEEAFGL